MSDEFVDKAGDAAKQAAATAEELARRAADTAEDVASQAAETAGNFTQKVGEKVSSATKKTMEFGHNLPDLLRGLPGVRGYVEKELRRDADRRLRRMIANELSEDKIGLLNVQQQLLREGGLKWLDEVDGAIQKLQILIGRVQTASQGYAGLFDAVRILDEQLEALHKFDVALAENVSELSDIIEKLSASVGNDDAIPGAIQEVISVITELNVLVQKRYEAVLDPDLLKDASYIG